MTFKSKFFVQTHDLKQQIKLQETVKSVDFTVLSASFSSDSEEHLNILKECIAAFPKEFVRNLVCIRPERLIEHEILAQLQATVKLDRNVDDEADTFGKAFTLVQKALDTKKIEHECLQLYKEILSEVTRFFDDVTPETLPESDFLSLEDRKLLKSLYSELSTKEPWSHDSALLKSVCIQRATALIYTRESRKIIAPEVEKSISHFCSEKAMEPLEPVKKEEGIAIFTTGGVASGKGTCLRNIQETLQERSPHPIQWNQMVHHNADRLKPFLQNPELDPLKYSQYTYEEALLVKERVMQILEQRGKQLGGYPHFLHDQTKLKPDELREAASRYGEVVITAISTEVSSSIKWAYQRGKKTGRYEHTEGLLGSHQAVPGEFIKSLNQEDLIGKGNISVAMYDNNSPTRELTMFASIDMHNKTITIYDDEMMQKWIKKENINTKADPHSELYFNKPTRSTAEYFTPLTEKGFKINYEQDLGSKLESGVY